MFRSNHTPRRRFNISQSVPPEVELALADVDRQELPGDIVCCDRHRVEYIIEASMVEELDDPAQQAARDVVPRCPLCCDEFFNLFRAMSRAG